MFEIRIAVSRLNLDNTQLDHFLNAPTGEVGRALHRVGLVMVAAAKRQVGVDTGALMSSIHLIHERVGLGPSIMVGSDNDIAYLHHEGTRPHLITHNRASMLRFHAGGRVIYTRQVMHPGTQPNHYLSDQLILVAGR